MNITNLIVLIKVFFGYSILVFGLSAFFLKPILVGKGFTKSLLACFLAGNFYVMNVVFILLLFFHCSNRFLTIFFLLLGAVVIRVLFDFSKITSGLKGAWYSFQRLISGTYGWHLFFRRVRRTLFGSVREGVQFLFVKHLSDVAGVVFCLLIHGSYTAYRLLLYSGYGGYDEVVHTAWIQGMMGGEIYSAGVYPFGFHEMIYAVANVFGIYAQQVVRNFGFVTIIYMALMMYCLVAEILENRLIAFATLFFYSAVCIYRQGAWERFGFGYPQEFGLVCIYPMIIFLFYYLKEKDLFSLIFFGMAFSMTLYIHYYITIVALLLCFCMGVVYFIHILKRRMLVPILLCGIIASIIGASTMVLGVATGHRLQGSLYWALGVIGGNSEEEEEEVQETETEEETTAWEDDSEGYQGEGMASGSGIVTGSMIGSDGTGEGISGMEEEEETVPLLERIKEKLIVTGDCIKRYAISYCVTENGFWGFLCLWLVTLILSVIRLFIRKQRIRGEFCLAFLFYIFILCVLLSSEGIGLPVIIEDYRIRVFLCYALPFIIAVPIHFLWMVAEWIFLSKEKDKEHLRISLRRYGMIPISIFMLITLVNQNLIRQPSSSIVIQANKIVDVFYDKIIDQYDDYTWTLVSDVQEYAMCLNHGRHYEWTELLTQLSDGTVTIKIPTKYVFFAIEKRPISYGTVIETGQPVPLQGIVSREHAQELIDPASVGSADNLYVQYRLQIMSKAYYWAKTYAELFPEEMKVYYEDDDVIYYCLTQETYYLNNLKIDYKYNSLTGDVSANELQENEEEESEEESKEESEEESEEEIEKEEIEEETEEEAEEEETGQEEED